MRKWTLVLPGMLLLGTAVAWVGRERGQQHTDAAPVARESTGARAAPLERPPLQLNQRGGDTSHVSTQAQAVGRAGNEASPTDTEDAEEEVEPEGLPPQTPEQCQAAEHAQQARLYAMLDQRFTSQGVDGAWRRETEARLNEAVSSIALASAPVKLQSSECRSDICKSTLTHDTPRPSPEFMLQFLRKAGVGLESHLEYDDGRTILYSLRRDDALPAEP